MKNLKLDPKGYFLIKIGDGMIHLAFCSYQKKKGWYDSHDIKLSHSADNKEELLGWAIHHELYSQEDHYVYLVRELTKAEKCLKNKEKYIQK